MAAQPEVISARIGSPLAVVIVNYRTPLLAIEAARSVLDDLARIGGRCVIVDNCSGGDSKAALKEFAGEFPALVLFIEAAANGGFAAGNNLGMRAVHADYYLLLNSDAAAETGALQALLDAARAAPLAGIVTPLILRPGGQPETSRFRRHSLLAEFIDGAHLGPLTRRFQRAEVPIAPDDWRTMPDWVSFAAVLLSRAAIEAVGPMDEGYFLYFEDCDYCLRIVRAGFSIALAPAARFHHAAGASTKFNEKCAALARLPAYYYGARSRFFRRHYGPFGALLANLAWYGGRAIAHLRGLIGRPAPKVSAARGRDLWIGWLGRDDPQKRNRPPKGPVRSGVQ